ncbi:nuclear transport factor 2 family protein [Dyella agri]|uniref:Nuclear transport factor 2 family protein n=1 Tax=Dyella agri TaxID=1926869 RepID=A0ABW8KDC2_9GAMM
MKHHSDLLAHPRRGLAWSLAAGLASVACMPAHAQATAACHRPELQGQKRDAATIQRLERAWSATFLTGDAELESCLLLPAFTEIFGDGRTGHLDDELALARANQGKHLPIPAFPGEQVLLHGDAAVAYGVSTSKGADGQVRRQWFADYYVWDRGTWHVSFAQQTPIKQR